MSQERFTRAELRTIILVVLLGAVGVGVALQYYPIAFPEASIEFKVSRPEIEQRARTFLQQRGFDLTPYRQLILFRYDDTAKTYLERELGLAEANRLMASEINVWRWKVRFFKPPEKEELLVWLDPAGQIVGFEHIIEEKAPGARLEKPQAQSVAEIFLHSRMGLNLDDYAMVEDTLEERPNRLDYRFTWERKDFKAKEATYRISASVHGDQVGKVLPFLKVPEQWERDYRRLRSRNETLQTVANLFYVPLLIAIVFVLIPGIRQRRIMWKPLLWLGGTVGCLFALFIINSLPLQSENFPTATPYWVFVTGTVIIGLVAGLLLALFISILAASGDALYREAAPDKVALPRLFTFSGLRTKEFFTSTLVGYALAAFQLGFVVVFYLVARRFGAWSPAEVPFDNFLSTTLPWIYPLTIGLIAATSEEFAFRLFAIPFLKKYLKSTWLAVLIPAFIWGFLHSNYPQQPAWIRGVEVGLVGVVFGFVLLRFGILATLVSHYTYNAVLISLFLLRSENFYFMLAGGLVMDAALIPLAIAGAFYWQHRRFAAEPELFNAALAAPPPRPVEVPTPVPVAPAPEPTAAVVETVYTPLPGKKLGVAAAAGVFGLVLWWFLPVEQPLDFLRWQKNPQEAEAIADQFLQDKGVNPGEWRRVTSFQRHFQRGSSEYVRRRGGMKQVNELWSSRLALGTASWRVRYFRPLQKEEHLVYIAADGQVARHDHLLDEKAPGADLTQSEAQQRAADYLARTYQLDVSGWKLVESELEKRDNRTDHHLIWEDPKPVVAGAFVRAEVQVRGDEASGYRPFLKVPEEWLRELNKPRIQQIIADASIFLFIIWVLILGARFLPRHTFRWRLYIGLGILLAGVNLLTHLNRFRVFGRNYNTSIPWETYVFHETVSVVLATMGIAFLTVLLALAADLFYASRWSTAALVPSQVPSRFPYYRDAVVVGLAAALFFQGLVNIYNHFEQRFPVPHQRTNPSFGSVLDGYLPGLSAGIDAVLGGLFFLALVAIVVGILKSYFRSPVRRAAVLALVLLFFSLDEAIGVRQFFQRWAFGLLVAALFVLAIRYFFRTNLFAYLVGFTLVFLASDALYYWRQPSPLLHGSAVTALLTASVFLLALMTFLQRSTRQLSPPGS
ncbi:MAG: lysostaphin resistance A-like protein [Terriglobia bacterium]